ncbi:ABC transporter ATP-binding protein [Calderihabitans maritimus]|uniref:Oligopeptide/dipeptide ABC transporter ATPase n=1 Tax=Calderihabitans maritimus TaxID=1246530 RepID=A0A1Z5HPY8_9FIRM|nr:ABC transporter ATP-binding protein [Calderihabitans maritimus]GAW91599.1 oligopeptide/dipeptide ABC transporter ATPase [Calderihabitans maritimus]
MAELLEVVNLKTHFFTKEGIVKAVDGVNFSLKPGQTMGIVGESGSGKSITALSIMRLVPTPPGKIVDGRIYFNGRDILRLSEEEMRKIRGNEISMIFQDPMTSLNPVLTVGEQIVEALVYHRKMKKKEAWAEAVELLEKVGIPEARSRVKHYPHQFSGGMRQRAMIAMAIACNPKLLIADEPTTALDVTIQAQILDLMRNLKKNYGTAIIMITHDLGVVAELCEQVLVMYAGTPVEFTDVKTLFGNPKHPYTWGLLQSIPQLYDDEKQRLKPIRGMPPDLKNMKECCPFVNRCDYSKAICHRMRPVAKELAPGHRVACHLY